MLNSILLPLIHHSTSKLTCRDPNYHKQHKHKLITSHCKPFMPSNYHAHTTHGNKRLCVLPASKRTSKIFCS